MKDLTGQQFGRLIAIRPTEECRHHSMVWECRCDCGNTAFVRSADLCAGNTKSCGCLKKENAVRNGKKRKITYDIDLVGQQFGRLTVLRRSEERASLWECRCDCGNTSVQTTYRLINGMAKSYGCLHREHLASYGKSKRKELSGKKFGRLVALRPTEERKHGAVIWECRCECGNIAFVSRDALHSGGTRSCGCLRKGKARNMVNSKAGNINEK